MEEKNNVKKSSLSVKMVVIGFLIFLLMIPTFMIMGLIQEREKTQAEAIDEVSQKWGGKQTLAGPILSLPYKKTAVANDGSVTTIIQYAQFLPEKLNIEGTVKPEFRRRGIYEIVVYDAQYKISGEITKPNLAALNLLDQDINWENALVSLGISDLRGIQEAVNLKLGEENYLLEPGVEIKDIIQSGLSVKVPLKDLMTTNLSFVINLNLKGSQEINFLPLGKETQVKLASSWPTPSFNGAFLPDDYKLTDEGFSANWRVLHLNRNFPQQWLASASTNIFDSAFGVNLLVPVDGYQKSMRTVKYAILLIFLTFAVYFFVEVFNKRRIHSIHYLLVGFALCLFYLLLLSLSEYFNFDWAYLIAGVATISLITIYSRSILGNGKLTLIQGLILIMLYSFIYVLIQLEDWALLLGSIGLFIILAIAMYLAKKINWYNEG